MEIEYGKRKAFWGYLSSLRHLEQAFRAVGKNVNITLSVHRKGEKYVTIECNRDICPMSIDNLTPEQMAKSVANYLATRRADVYYDYCREAKRG
jgi:hypothetical protein